MWVFWFGELDVDREEVSDPIKKRYCKFWMNFVPVFSDEAVKEVEDARFCARFWAV